jgi:hypothetical protein
VTVDVFSVEDLSAAKRWNVARGQESSSVREAGAVLGQAVRH